MAARILVADGTATSRFALKARLGAACYSVFVAGSTAELMEQIEACRPDLVIVSGSLSDAGQVATCEKLARAEGMANVPVLIMAPHRQRVAGLQAGATAVLDPDINEQMLLARIRRLLRDADLQCDASMGMAEDAGSFRHAPVECVSLVGDSLSRAIAWKRLLSQKLPYNFTVNRPEDALSAVAEGQHADLYVIATGIRSSNDGLHLLSELKSRAGSRDSAFVIATDNAQDGFNAFALDLGAHDVLPLNFGSEAGIEAAALSLKAQMTRKKHGDSIRAEKQRMLQSANIDPLTGLFNRRVTLPRLEETARDAIRDGRSFAVLVMDLDFFKSVNDRHGHLAGDAVLAEAARRLEETVGAKGLVARHGGEEFVAILPDMSDSTARNLAEAIRRRIAAGPIPFSRGSGDEAVNVTISVGVAHSSCADFRLRPEAVARQMIERADQALMQAKVFGRNRVVSLSPGICARGPISVSPE